MDQLPKIVQQRLQAAPKAEAHPDADLITAFVERSLSLGERGALMEHLANCADCRMIVALARPQMEHAEVAAAVAAPAHGRSGWLRWPVMGWVAAAACVLVVGTAVTLRHREREKSSGSASGVAEIAAYSAPKSSEAQPTQDQVEESAPVEPKPSHKAESSSAAAELAKKEGYAEKRRMAALSPPAFPGVVAGKIAGFRPQIAMAAPRTPKSGAAGAMAYDEAENLEAGTAGSAKQQSSAQSSSARETSQIAVNALAPSPMPQVVESQKELDTTKKAQVASTSTAIGGSYAAEAKISQAPAKNEAVMRTAANFILLRWSISSDGSMVLRSLDSGNTWERAPVGGGMIFRAVAASGPEVWAGGSGGSVYHSSDVGQHWSQIRPAVDAKALTEDIVQIGIGPNQLVRLTTASGAVWSTSDNGKTWQAK